MYLTVIINNKHIHFLPASQLFWTDQQLFFKFVSRLLWCKCNKAFKGTRAQVRTGNTTQQTFGKISQFKRIKNIKQILFKFIVLIFKRESNKCVAVKYVTAVINLTYSACRGY